LDRARGNGEIEHRQARGLCARSRRGFEQLAGEVLDSLMISENAVRHTVSHISSTTVISRDHMISSRSVGLDAGARLLHGRSAVTRGAGARTSPSAMRSSCPRRPRGYRPAHEGGGLALLHDAGFRCGLAGRSA